MESCMQPMQLTMKEFSGTKGDVLISGLQPVSAKEENLVTMSFMIVDHNYANDGILSIKYNEAELEESLGITLNVSKVTFFHNDPKQSVAFVDVRNCASLENFVQNHPHRHKNIVEFPVRVLTSEATPLGPKQP